MNATVRAGTANGFESIVLENSLVRVVVLPRLGGRVWELEDKTRQRQWIWHREGVPLAAAPIGSSYDDVWAGGWEELFPNDAPGDFERRKLPDHGEWWTLEWSIAHRAEGDEAVLRLEAESQVVRASCVKEFRLGASADTLTVSYRVESREDHPVHFLFKQHLPIQISPACQLALPGGMVHPVDTTFGTLLREKGPFEWPIARRSDGTQADLRLILPQSNAAREFVYVDHLPEPWCGIDDAAAGASLRMHFDAGQFPYVWLFLSYGGWRDCYTAVLEPCTNMPKDLSEALRLGQTARLPAGGVFETTVAVTLGAFRRTN